MLSKHEKSIRCFFVLLDIGFSLLSAFFVVLYCLPDMTYMPSACYIRHIFLLFVIIAVNIICYEIMGFYRDICRWQQYFFIVKSVFVANLISFFIFSSLIFIFNLHGIDRGFVSLVYAVTFTAVALDRILANKFLKYVRAKGYGNRNILIVGTGRRAQRFIKGIDSNREYGLNIVGLVDKDKDKVGDIVLGYKVIGSLDDIEAIIENRVIDDVVFVVPRAWLNSIEDIIFKLEIAGISVVIAVDHFDVTLAKAKHIYFNGFNMIQLDSAPDRVGELVIKRIIDVIISATALVVLSPLFLITAVMIKLTSDGPVFFVQKRCGLNKRVFNLYKFRTMYENAEDMKDELRDANEMRGPVFKIENDPRLTKVGKFLRRWSIDELPQLWNVLIGDMSLVGPRPLPVDENDYYPWQRRRLSVKPGITCLWQVSGRNEITDFDEWVKLDLAYIDNWSIWLDMKILFLTIPAIISGKGAK